MYTTVLQITLTLSGLSSPMAMKKYVCVQLYLFFFLSVLDTLFVPSAPAP